MSAPQIPTSPIARLQRFARPTQPQKRCDLCGAPIAVEHPHLLELKSRQLACSCSACAILFSSETARGYRRIPDRVRLLRDLDISDVVWESLCIPINLAFFYRKTDSQRVLAIYPSPGGAMESLLPMDNWNELAGQCPALAEMQSDVEALLVNRIGKRREAMLVPIDACFKLVGIIRTNWQGLSGGRDVWDNVEKFFADLYRKAGENRSLSNA